MAKLKHVLNRLGDSMVMATGSTTIPHHTMGKAADIAQRLGFYGHLEARRRGSVIEAQHIRGDGSRYWVEKFRVVSKRVY